jgi:molecular chaperone IbpA
MTNIANTFDSMFKDFGRYYVGSEDLINRLSKIHDDANRSVTNYPPYNLKKTGENTYQIEMAVAGFSKQDIDIELKEDKLVIIGKTGEDALEKDADFLFRGIANRAFTRTFTLSDQIIVNNADLVNGILRIFLEKIIPDHKKPRKIEVNDTLSHQLLTE